MHDECIEEFSLLIPLSFFAAEHCFDIHFFEVALQGLCLCQIYVFVFILVVLISACFPSLLTSRSILLTSRLTTGFFTHVILLSNLRWCGGCSCTVLKVFGSHWVSLAGVGHMHLDNSTRLNSLNVGKTMGRKVDPRVDDPVESDTCCDNFTYCLHVGNYIHVDKSDECHMNWDVAHNRGLSSNAVNIVPELLDFVDAQFLLICFFSILVVVRWFSVVDRIVGSIDVTVGPFNIEDIVNLVAYSAKITCSFVV